MHLAYIWIVSHLSAKNYRNWWKFDEVLTKTNLLSFFWDTVYFLIQLDEIIREGTDRSFCVDDRTKLDLIRNNLSALLEVC